MTQPSGSRLSPAPNPADVILTGAAIYESIMEQFGFEEMSVSTRGLRYWALLKR